MALLSIKNISEKDWEVVDNQTLYLSVLSESVDIPEGFVITSEVFEYVIERLGIKKKIDNLVRVMNPAEENRLQDIANEIQKLIINCELPDDVRGAILEAYDNLGISHDVSLQELTESENMPLVELQSAPVNYNDEEIFIYNINSQEKLIEGVLSCFGLHYAGKRLKYRLTNGLEDKGVSITVKKSLNPGLSGIAYMEGNKLVLKAVHGYYSGSVEDYADTYYIDPENDFSNVKNNRQTVIEKYNEKENKLIKEGAPSHIVHEKKLDEENLARFSQLLKNILGKFAEGFYVGFAVHNQKFYINSVLYKKEEISKESFPDENEVSDNQITHNGLGEGKSFEAQPQTGYMQSINTEQQQDGKSIFSMFKEKEEKTDSKEESQNPGITKQKNDGENLVTAARHSLGQAVVQCDMAITKRLQQEYRRMFDDDSLTDLNDLLEVLSRECEIPSIDDLREIREIRNRYIENMKTPSIPEVKYVFDKTRNFFNEF